MSLQILGTDYERFIFLVAIPYVSILSLRRANMHGRLA